MMTFTRIVTLIANAMLTLSIQMCVSNYLLLIKFNNTIKIIYQITDLSKSALIANVFAHKKGKSRFAER